jgi:hypothetical protein
MTRGINVLLVTLGIAACARSASPTVAASTPPASVSPARAPDSVHYIVTENLYFAKPGQAEEVWRVRNHVSDVLAANGLHGGTVLRGPGGEGPDVIWQSPPFSSMEELKAEAERALATPAVVDAMKEMQAKTRRFERRRYEIVKLDVLDDPDHPAPWGLVPRSASSR